MGLSKASRTRSGRNAAASHELILRTSNLQDPKLIEVYTGLSNQDVEQYLKTTTAPTAISGDSDLSVWDYIHRQQGKSVAEAVQQILVQQVEAVEDVGYDVGVLMHYAHTHQVWKTHPDPQLRSSDAWMSALEMNRSLATTMLTGALGKSRKQRYLVSIAKHWGHDWYNVLDDGARPSKSRADRLGQKELQCLESIASSGTTLDEASRKFHSTIAARLARTNRKLKDHRNFLVRQDLESLMPWCRKLKEKRKGNKLKSGNHARQREDADEEGADQENSEQQSSDGDSENESVQVVVRQNNGDQGSAQPRSQSYQSDDDDRASSDSIHNEPEKRTSHVEDDSDESESNGQQGVQNHHHNDAKLHTTRSAKRIRTDSSTSDPDISQQSMEACCQQIGESMARLKDIIKKQRSQGLSESSGIPACLIALCDAARNILGEFAAEVQDMSRERRLLLVQGIAAQPPISDQSQSENTASIDHLIARDFASADKTAGIEDEVEDTDLFGSQILS